MKYKAEPCDCPDQNEEEPCYYLHINGGYYSKYCLDGACYCNEGDPCDRRRFNRDKKHWRSIERAGEAS